MTDNSNRIDPVDAQIGGDADIGGIAKTITVDDVRTTLLDTAPVQERIALLNDMRREIAARDNADRGNDHQALLAEIDHALATLQR